MNGTKCRLCLVQLRPSTKGPSVRSIQAAIERVFYFQIKMDKSFPAYVCSKCACTVKQFDAYCILVQSNQEKLQQDSEQKAVTLGTLDLDRTTTVSGVSSTDWKPFNSSIIDDSFAVLENLLRTEVPPVGHIRTASCDADLFRTAEQHDVNDNEDTKSELCDTIEVEEYKLSIADEFNKDQLTDSSTDASEEDVVEDSIESEQCRTSEKLATKKQSKEHVAKLPQTLQCDVCYQEFSRKDSLAKHKDIKHPANVPPSISCDQCDRMFVNITQLKEHRWHSHNDRKCPVCKKLIKMRVFNIHVAAHRSAFYCDACRKSFSSKKILKLHQDRKHASEGSPTVSCTECESSFANRTLLNDHRRSRHIKRECPICKEQILVKRFTVHVATHRSTCYCDVCNHVFSKPANLRRHRLMVHSVGPSTLINCDVCEQQFSNRTQLIEHRQCHRKKTKCPKCKKLITSKAFKEHLDAHRGSFRCDVCNKMYSTGANLKRHKLQCKSKRDVAL